MSSLVRIAQISASSQSLTGLNGYLDAVEELVRSTKIHSGQDVTAERQENNNVWVFCPADQDFDRAENCVRLFEPFIRPHQVLFRDGKMSFAMEQ
jgi:hypothetical protein